MGLAHHGWMTFLFIFTPHVQLIVCEGTQWQNCRQDCSDIRGKVYTASEREKISRDTGKSPEQGKRGREQGEQSRIAETAEESRAQPAGE